MAETETKKVDKSLSGASSSLTYKHTYGRREIFTDYEMIDSSNILEVLRDATIIHNQNYNDIDYLYKYYKGKQPIIYRVKDVRPEINNKIVENRANQIVSYKTGYLLNQPIEYVSKGGVKGESITQLNDWMEAENKATLDKQLVDWMHICGVGYRYVNVNQQGIDFDESPFEVYTLDPRFTFVVKSSDLRHRVLMGVSIRYMNSEENPSIQTPEYTCYTETEVFVVRDEAIQAEETHLLGHVPIIEYPLNMARLGAFETVLPLLDAINTAESNRVDGLEQFVQALLIYHNVDIDEETHRKVQQEGAIAYKDTSPDMRGEVQYLVSQLDQNSTQTLIDSMYESVLEIVGLPKTNGGTNTDANGVSVVLQSGYADTETFAHNTELMYKRSEKQFLRIVLNICEAFSMPDADTGASFDLELTDIDINFTRRNYDNILSKSQVLTTMLTCADKDGNRLIEPSLAFIHSGMFVDSDNASKISQEFYEKQKKEKQEQADKIANGQMGESNDEEGNSASEPSANNPEADGANSSNTGEGE